MMKKRILRLVAVLATLVLAGCAGDSGRSGGGPPNIIVIFADDLGYGDLSSYGSPVIQTPELDKMALEGMRFTDFYAASSKCSPSRAALLTGRLPIRSGIVGHLNEVFQPYSLGGLPADEWTVAEALKELGYATACIGKWHLGHLEPFLPRRYGFDYYYGIITSNNFNRDQRNRVPMMRNEEVIDPAVDQRTITARYTDEAEQFIRQNRDRPFFLYLPHTFPHAPHFASERFEGRSRAGIYGDSVEELDWSVGQLLSVLREEGLAENTLVIFTSDNGPSLNLGYGRTGSAGPLRGGKRSTWEGGFRVPAIAWWPGRVPAGSVSTEMASIMDFLPTFLELAGGQLPEGLLLDGRSIVQALAGDPAVRDDPFFYYHKDVAQAVRLGRYKVHFHSVESDGPEIVTRHDPPLVYDLFIDPREDFSISARHPKIIAEARKALESHDATLTEVVYQLDLLDPDAITSAGQVNAELRRLERVEALEHPPFSAGEIHDRRTSLLRRLADLQP